MFTQVKRGWIESKLRLRTFKVYRKKINSLVYSDTLFICTYLLFRERSLLYEPTAFYTPVSELEEAKNGGISVLTGRRVVRIDTAKQVENPQIFLLKSASFHIYC